MKINLKNRGSFLGMEDVKFPAEVERRTWRHI